MHAYRVGNENALRNNMIWSALRKHASSNILKNVTTKKGKFSDHVFSPYEILCCVYSLESPHRGDSNEYTQLLIFV